MEFLQELFYVLKKFLFQTGAIRRDIFNAYINKASEFLFQTGAIRRLSEEDGQEVLKMGNMSEVAYARSDLQDGQENGQEEQKWATCRRSHTLAPTYKTDKRTYEYGRGNPVPTNGLRVPAGSGVGRVGMWFRLCRLCLSVA